MSSPVPRDIARKFEQRWSARFKQTESFSARAERLKRSNPTLVEGAQPPIDTPPPADETTSTPLVPGLPADED